VLLPTPRAASLAAAGLLVALLALPWPRLGGAVLALDLLLLAAVAADALRAPRPGSLAARRGFADPMSAFAPAAVGLELAWRGSRAAFVRLADAPPSSFESQGHRMEVLLPPRGEVALGYRVVPRSRGDFRFGDLHVRAAGPWGLAARQWRTELAAAVRVYPDLRGLARLDASLAPGSAPSRRGGIPDGREFEGLRPHLPGDDVRRVDWKATARRGAPVVREMGPERSQTVWLLLDCGRPLAGRLPGGRTRLDGAVDACLALSRAATRGGDRVGLVAFGSEVRALVPPGRGSGQLGPLAAALYGLDARPEEPCLSHALDLVQARQGRRALVVLFTDLTDPESGAALVARATLLCRRHLVLLVAPADPALSSAAASRPSSVEDAFARVAAARILAEREAALARLRGTGVRVADVAAGQSASAAALTGYASAKASGRL